MTEHISVVSQLFVQSLFEMRAALTELYEQIDELLPADQPLTKPEQMSFATIYAYMDGENQDEVLRQCNNLISSILMNRNIFTGG